MVNKIRNVVVDKQDVYTMNMLPINQLQHLGRVFFILIWTPRMTLIILEHF